MDLKQKASSTAIFCASILALGKFISGIFSGSMTVISSGLDSLLDIFMSFINFLAIRKAEMPPDKNHLYGHGKVEDLAAILQSLVIMVTGIIIINKAIEKYMIKAAIIYTMWDFLIMLISLIFSFFISRFLHRIGKITNSNTLKADALHYASDLYSNSGGIIAILLTFFTGKTFFDLIFAVIIGIFIIFSASKILKSGIYGLSDVSLSENIKKQIESIIDNMPLPYAGYHRLRTRSSGSRFYIDFHLLVCRKATVDEAHELANKIEQLIVDKIGHIDVLTHIEPCPYTCNMTEDTCRVLKMRKKN